MHKAGIVYFTKHTSAGPSSRHRSYAYHPFLEENGMQVTVYPLFPASYLQTFYNTGRKPIFTVLLAYLRRLWQVLFLARYDVVFIEYELFPYLPFWFEKLFLRTRFRIVLDYDDAIFHNYDQSEYKIVKKLCGNKIYRLVSLASVVITGSPYLTKTLSPFAKHVVEIPTSVSLQKYLSTPAAALPGYQKQAFRIGWIGSATTSRFVLSIKDSLLQLQHQVSTLLVLIGFDRRLEEHLFGLHYVIYDWDEDTEIALLKTCDAGIMPLTNEAFNYGKCGFKLIQYMACGLPTVSTPMEANVKINRNGGNLFAHTTDGWTACLKKIADNKSFYEEVGLHNLSIIEAYYASENNRYIYLSIFQKLVRQQQ